MNRIAQTILGGICLIAAAQAEQKKYRQIIGIAVVAIIGLLPSGLPAESQSVAQSGLSSGIVVALDFPDGKAVEDLQADDREGESRRRGH